MASPSLNPAVIVKRPMLSEKSTFGSSELGRYTFLVDSAATKTEIKNAIQDLYKVKVVSVNTSNRKAADRRLKYGLVEGKTSKKAVVRVAEGQAIELF